MAEIGWIKTYRKIQDCWIWLDKEPFDKRSAWIDLLLTANHSDKKILFNGELITVQRGQILTSIRKLSEKWKWSYDKCSRFLKLLVDDEMLQKESDNSRTLLTIVNYEIYQDCTSTDECADNGTNRTQTSEQTEHEQVTNKNVKNVKNNIICSNSLSECEQKIDKKTQKEELEKNFKIIYDSYPKKVGKARGFDLYKGWLKGRDISGKRVKLTNKQMWSAIAKYKHQLEENGTEKQYMMQFDTFMNKPILDYLEVEE